ncbi:MAG TPA: hypothetical protein VIV11_04915 [Kofleriaceae bacterium]
MRGTTWIVVASMLAMSGCGGDDDESSDQGPPTGNVTIKTHPGMRVDFMRAADDSIISSKTTDADGNASETIDRGDRAVIIAGLGTIAPRVAVIDGLLAEREYRWLFGYSYLTFGGTATAVSWPAVAGASFYMIDSRCGGTYDAGVSETMDSVSLCTDGDAILISAIADDRGGRTVLASAYQEVPAASVGQPLAITAPFMAGRELTLTLANPGATMMRDAFATLVVAPGVSIELQPNLDSATSAKVSLPSMPGTLRTHVMGFKPTGALVAASDQRPMTDAVTLDLDGGMPDYDLNTEPTYDAATATINWTIIGTGTPDAVFVESSDRAFSLIAPYAGPSLHIPVLPSDVPPKSPSGVPVMLSSAGGFAETVSALGNRYDASASFTFNMSGVFYGN